LIVKEQIGSSASISGYTFGVASITGVILAVRWGLDILGSPVLGALADRIGRQRSLPVIFMIGSLALGSAALPFGVFWLIGFVLIVFLCDALLGILVAAWAGQEGGRSVADYATGMDFGMALGPLIGWGIAHFGLPSFLIFLVGAVFYITGGVVTKQRTRSI
jgi:MFS family permease